MRQPVPFIGPAYTARSVAENAQRTINLYPEIDNQQPKNVIALYRTPGLVLEQTLPGTNRGNGLYTTTTGRFFAVNANKLYEIFANGTNVERGSLLTYIGIVFICDNGATASIGGDQMMITDGTYGYIYNFTTNILSQITDVNFPGGGPCCFFKQFFLVVKPGTREVYSNDPNTPLDGTVWNALAFGVKESVGDPIVGLETNSQSVLVIGSQSMEVWYDSGAYPFSFECRLGSENTIGCAARGSVFTINKSIFWIGDGNYGRGVVWALNGFIATRVSNHFVENYLASQPVLNDAVAWGYEREGHYYYCLSLPSADRTLCYDQSTDMWHDRAYLDPVTGFFSRHRAISCCFFQGKHFVSDYENGNIYLLDPEEGTDNGNPLKWLRSSPHISENQDRFICDEFEIVIDSGNGSSNNPGKYPTCNLRISTDGAHTFSQSRKANMGMVGAYKTRCYWTRNGQGKDFVFEVSGDAPVKTVLIQAVSKMRKCVYG